MKATSSCTLAVLVVLGALAGCGGAPRDAHDPEPRAPHAETAHAEASHGDEGSDGHEGHEGEEHAGEDEIRVPLDGLRGLAFARAGAPVEEGVWAPAEAVSDERAVAVVAAPASGRVRSLRAAAGESVRRGQVVAELDSAEVADLVARRRAARAEAERAARDAGRERSLEALGATSRREVEAAVAAAEAAQAEAEAAERSLAARGVDPERFDGTLAVTAPAAGTIERWEVALGEGVQAGVALATIRDRAAARVRVELAPPAPDWGVGSVTEVRRGDGVRWQATVEGVPAGLSTDTRRFPYLLRLAEPPFPSPGTPLEVRVPLERGIVLPQEALQIIEGEWGVFVREGNEAVFRRVRRGAEVGGDVLVLAGLEPEAEVATAGAYLLRPLWMKRMGGGEEHAH
jgi:cobalt-zinc-cadmium efflux system membrane fusion protein